VQTRADIERLMDQVREANERLIVAAAHAENLSDAAHRASGRIAAHPDNPRIRRRCAIRSQGG